jgi:hypothetical protein
LTRVWGDVLFSRFPPGVKSVYRYGWWSATEPGVAVFLLPTANHQARAEDKRAEVEAALSAHFGAPLRVRIEVEEGGGDAGGAPRPSPGPIGRDRPAPAPPRRAVDRPPADEPPPYDGPPIDSYDGPAVDSNDEPMSTADFEALEDAPDAPATAMARIQDRFPGSQQLDG